jgi:hypothetical protein
MFQGCSPYRRAPRSKPCRWLALAALAVSLLGGGCGAIREQDAQQSAWAERANDVCADLKREFADVEAPETEEEWYTLIRPILRADLSALAELRRIDPPPGESGKVSRFLGLYQAHDDVALLGVAAYERNEVARARELFDESLELGRKADALARELGAVECALPSEAAHR